MHDRGFTLMELLLAMALAATVFTGTLQLAGAAGGGFRLQQNIGALQENARFTINVLQREIRAAGFHPRPWELGTGLSAISGLSVESPDIAGDRLVVQRWSVRNCFDNPNPVRGANGRPAYYQRQTEFRVSTEKNLTLTCRYGPDNGNLQTQINGLGLVQNAESFQVLFAEDTDADGNADRWVASGQWLNETNVLAVRLAFMLATPDPVRAPSAGPAQVLDVTGRVPADGRLRRVFESVIAIQGRAG